MTENTEQKIRIYHNENGSGDILCKNGMNLVITWNDTIILSGNTLQKEIEL